MKNKASIEIEVPIGLTLVPSIRISLWKTKASTMPEQRMTSTFKTQYNHRCNHYHSNNALLFLLPLLLMMLKETSALPPIIKIGKFIYYV